MKIKTKFDIGQKIWYINALELVEGLISGIYFWEDKTYSYEIKFWLGSFLKGSVVKNEDKLFATKEEAEKELKEKREC